MATVDESGLLLEQMQKNGQNVLRRKVFRVNRRQLTLTSRYDIDPVVATLKATVDL